MPFGMTVSFVTYTVTIFPLLLLPMPYIVEGVVTHE
jgi:hypothetical protein